MNKAKILIWSFRAIMAAAVVVKICMGETGLAIYGTLALCLTFSPELIKLFFKFEVPMGLCITLTMFVFFAMTVAKLFYLYELTTWWDKLLHLGSGAILAYIGALIAKTLLGDTQNVSVILIFGFMFALSIGALWEIWEFSGDVLFGLDSQIRETGVFDTMGDII
ncbi:MAG: hypothetical protein RSA70_06925, partial [Clostridia bacterium]